MPGPLNRARLQHNMYNLLDIYNQCIGQTLASEAEVRGGNETTDSLSLVLRVA